MGRIRSIVLMSLLVTLPQGAEDVPAAVPVAAPEEPRLVVHGYLAQAYAIASGAQILGIPTDGTFDYRTAALQFRVAVAHDDSFVLQLSQERLGESPSMRARNEVDLDWVFYQHQFGRNWSARLGKVKLPFGIYNEIRFVGPLLPFFRATDVFYGEGSYTFDSVNGAVVSSHLFTKHRFNVDADVWAGEWRLLQLDNTTFARAKNGGGGQLWLNTPVTGLRFGLGGHRSTWRDSLSVPRGQKDHHRKWAASADGNFSRLRLNAEYGQDHFDGGSFQAGYAMASVHMNDKLSLTAQASRSHVKLTGLHVDLDIVRDYAVAASYALRTSVLLKAEHHWAHGNSYDDPLRLFIPARDSRYAILSLSVVF